LKALCKELRKGVQLLSKESQIEIEPEILTGLMDNLLLESEILFTVCPGAGGYDGIFVMGHTEDFKSKVEKVLSEFNLNSSCFKAHFLDLKFDNYGTTISIRK